MIRSTRSRMFLKQIFCKILAWDHDCYRFLSFEPLKHILSWKMKAPLKRERGTPDCVPGKGSELLILQLCKEASLKIQSLAVLWATDAKQALITIDKIKNFSSSNSFFSANTLIHYWSMRIRCPCSYSLLSNHQSPLFKFLKGGYFGQKSRFS